MMQGGQAPGFFGKLRTHGDFVGRRLPPPLRDCLDRWLQEGLVRSRLELGQDWLPVWSTSPLWRFVVGEGVCGGHAWAGVMMPSADKAGRCFPLLLAACTDAAPSLPACLSLHADWFERLEDLALSSLDEGFALGVFDDALYGLAGGPCCDARHGGAIGPAPMALPAAVAPMARAVLPALAGSSMERRSAWWTDGSPRVAPSLAVCTGLPSPEAYVALLDGRWAERGWSVLED